MGSTNRFADWSEGTSPSELSRELRLERGGHLPQRRRVAALSLTSVAAMGAISLYQTGLIRHLPEPPLPGFDADRVDAAPEAYEKLHAPDAVLGLVSYGATLALATMGGAERARKTPWIPLALAGKAMADAVQAAKLTWDQWAKHRAFCSYCLVASGATFATLPHVLPEARAAWRELTG